MIGVERLEAKLREACRGRLLKAEVLRNYTSFRVGGPADLLFFPVDTGDLAAALRAASDAGEPVFVMGNGTNILVRDGGMRGLTIHTGDMEGITEHREGVKPPAVGEGVDLTVLAGTPLSKVINHSVDRGLSGLEFAAGIPGTVGGAAWMNAGAHGSSFGDIVTWAALVDRSGGVFHVPGEEIDFCYRSTSWPLEGVIAEVGLRLTFRGESFVLEQVKHCLSERGKRLPLGVGMAGSVFKNPPGDFAGRIIEAAGLKGLRVGQAEVSRKHANVIINLGGASAGEIKDLVETVARRVREAEGIALETEIDIVGEEVP